MKRIFSSFFAVALLMLTFAVTPAYANGGQGESAPVDPDALHCKVERPDGTILSCWFCKCSELSGVDQDDTEDSGE